MHRKNNSRFLQFAVIGIFCFFASSYTAQSSESHGRLFEFINVPGAYCGDGSEYFVMVDIKDVKKVVVAFEGGGACWDLLTCMTQISTQFHQPSKIKQESGFFSDDPKVSPFAGASMIYFPYCTGDIFAGTFTKNYEGIYKVKHFGRTNVLLGLAEVMKIYGGLLRSYDEAVFYGYSAGALGLMMNFTDLEESLGRYIPKKSMFLDGMGLHWDETVWNRFDSSMLLAIKDGFKRVKVDFDPKAWPLSKKAIEVCRQFPDYEIGVLQGSMDLIIGVLFGLTNPFTHRKRVYGADGIYESLKEPSDNCSAFVPDTLVHTFLTSDGARGLQHKTKAGMTAYQFVRKIMTEGAGESYR